MIVLDKKILLECIKMVRRIPLLFAIASLVAIAGSAHSMTPGSTDAAKIVPILSLLLDEKQVDSTLPVADAGPDSQVLVGELVQLDGSASSDPESRPLTYLWSFASIPEGSSAVISSDTSSTPEFVLDVPGTYVVELLVNNGVQDSLADAVTISNTNRAPIADAGDNSLELLNQIAQLDASGSSDIDTDPLTYLWSIVETPDGSVAQLSDNTSVSPDFTPDIRGNYVFGLVVNDGFVDSDSDQREMLAGVELSLEIADGFFGVGRETTATVSLGLPAPSQGVVITLSVDETIIGLTDTQITFAAGESEKTLVLSGLSIGITDLSASGTNIPEESITIEVSGALVSVAEIEPLSPTASRSLAISLSDAAPLGGATINLESLDTAIATVDPTSIFIAEGQFTPAQNAQVTGVGLGSTTLRATATGFAPDERDVVVALTVEFDPGTLNVPETLSRDINLKLDAPAPVGGVTFDLMIVGDENFSVQNTVNIAEGQTQSQPITLTGLTEGVSILRATANGFIDADATITVVDAPNVFLRRNSSNSHLQEAVIGVGLQNVHRVGLEIPPTSAVDIKVSVPENSGVLLSKSGNLEGTDVLLFEDLVSSSTGIIYIQGEELGDDVPITIEVFNANTTTLAGYEALASTIDIDPSGVFLSTADFTVTSFTTNRSVNVQTALLHDDESGVQNGAFRQSLAVRGGSELQVTLQSDMTNLLTLPDGATGTAIIGANLTSASLAISPANSGLATISIVNQPSAGFSLPNDRDDNVQVTINTPKAFLRSSGSNSHLQEAIVGVDLQQLVRVGFESAPPGPVDVQISVPANSGVALSNSSTTLGSTQILLTNVSGSSTTTFYIHGLSLGDDIPVNIDVFNTNTDTPTGFDVLASTVDVDPSGIYVATSDYTTTSFSADRNISVSSALLYDAETPAREGERLTTQTIRGGLDLIVPMQVNNTAIASLPAGSDDDLIVLSGSASASILVSPVNAGQATVSIDSLPGNFVVPVGLDNNAVVTVSAPNAFLRSTGSASHLAEATIGIDLQTPHYIGLAATPPSAVDIAVSVPANSGVLLSTDSALAGSNSLAFTGVTTTRSPQFFIQGESLGDDVNVTITVFEAGTNTPIGYNSLASTVDIDPSGVSMSSADYQTNTFAPDRSIFVSASLLYDDEDLFSRDGQFRASQTVRGGISLNVPMSVDDDTIVVLPAGVSDTLIIPAGQSNGTILVDPQTAGQTTVSITSQPNANFTLPSNRDNVVVVTVTAPNARFNINSALVGDELQIPVNVSLAENPPNPVTVTIEVTAAAVALISKDATVAGSAVLTFENVTSASVGTIYAQGLTLNSATQIKVSAPGYSDDTADINVVDSGFRISGSFSNIDAGSSRNLSVSSARLNANGSFSASQQVRGGASFDILVSSSLPAVGTVTSPITLSGGDTTKTTTFNAIAPGTTTIQITQPAGFTPPVGTTDGDITVD